MSMITKAGVLAALLVLTPALPLAAAERPLAVGDLAPDLDLSDQHGKLLKLSELLAKRDYVVLAFYLRAFSGG
jgi:hypothetical protein